MSTICLLSTLLFFLSTVSTRPSPAIVYSAIITNTLSTAVQCNITWLQTFGDKLQLQRLTIEKDASYPVAEKITDMGSWEARSIIQKVQCGDVAVNAPFENVISPSVNWTFRVEPNAIVSVGSASSTA